LTRKGFGRRESCGRVEAGERDVGIGAGWCEDRHKGVEWAILGVPGGAVGMVSQFTRYSNTMHMESRLNGHPSTPMIESQASLANRLE
jgi:hypothetical protein